MKPKRYKETKYIRWMAKEEFNLMVKSLKPHELQYKLIFYIMFYMGLRVGEVVRLSWNNIMGDYETLVYTDIKTKGKVHTRAIPSHVKEQFEIYEFATKWFRTSNYIFEPQPRGGSKNFHLQTSSVRWRIKKLRDQLGLNYIYYTKINGVNMHRISPHTFRHWFVTKYYDLTKDLIETQRVIGHERAETTGVYIFKHGLLKKQREVMERM